MKEHASLYCLVLGAALAFAAPASAAVRTLVNDGFIDGGRTNGVDAGDIAWYSLGADTATANTVVVNNSFTSGQALRFTGTSANNYAVGNFSAVTLAAVGDYIEFSVQMRFTGTSTGGPMIGLFDSKGTFQTADGFGATNFTAVANDVGYKAIKSFPNSTSDFVIKSQNALSSFNSANGTTLETGTSGGAVALNTLYSMAFRAELLAGDQLSITSTFNGATVTTTTGALTKTFDEAIFSASGGGGGGTGDFSNLLITTNVIPEPSTYAVMAALAALGLAVVKRRRQ